MKKELEKFRRISDKEASGKLLAKMFLQKPTKRLIPHARKWVRIFPESKYAPHIVGSWMQNYPSQEVADLCEHYLETCHIDDMWKIARGVFLTRTRPKLYRLIEERLEQDPHSEAWDYCLTPHRRNKRVEALTHRFMELNEDIHETTMLYIALTTRDKLTIEKAYKWKLNSPTTKITAGFFRSLLDSCYKCHKTFIPKVVKLIRKWLRENQEDGQSSFLFCSLIQATESKYDIRNGKKWFLEHQDKDTAWQVIVGLLRISARHNIQDEFAIKHAMKILKKNPRKKYRILAKALVEAPCKESEKAYAEEYLSEFA